MRSIPFATRSLSATEIFAIPLFTLCFVAPRLFTLVFNSQFFAGPTWLRRSRQTLRLPRCSGCSVSWSSPPGSFGFI